MILNENRPCVICGKNTTETGGMTDGYMYCCEGKCFHKYMNKTYGKHKWMSLGNNEEDGYGGYYIHTSDVVGGYEGTGIYWTQWEE